MSTAQFLPAPNPDYIVSTGTDRSCRLWDLRSLRSPVFTIRTDAGINRMAISRANVLQRRQGGAIGSGGGGGEQGISTDSAAIPQCVFALPLDNRTVRLITSNGTRVGRIPRNTTHGHTRSITSAAWADEGLCNLFTTGFDHQLLGWQLQVS